jgi:hypothetical protein
MMSTRPFLTSLSHPASIAAIALLAVNDHFLKSEWPSWTTGKLSDIAGLVFFPLLLAAFVELVLPHGQVAPRRVIAACIGVTALVFTSVELVPIATNAYQSIWGALQWPLRLALDPTAPLSAVMSTPDPTDLLALPALGISWRIAATELRKERTPSTHGPRTYRWSSR